MDQLDDILTASRQRADDLDRQKRMIGRYLDDPLIQATTSVIDTVSKKADEVKAFVQPGMEEAGETLSQDVGLPVKKALSDPRTEAIGLGITTGGALTGQPELMVPGLAIMGMAKLAKGLIRPRINVEEVVARALNPSTLAERVTNVVNEKTAVLTDVEAQAKASVLVQAGGVSRDTLTSYAPGTSLMSAPHALASQEIVTNESRAFIDTARVAIDTNDPQLAEQALSQYARLLDPASAFTGAVTTTAQTLRVASSEDVKALNLLLERGSKLTEGLSPLDQLKHMMADPATDPAKQGKSLTQSFRNIMSQVKEVVATGDDAGAQVLLHEIKATVAEEAQLGLFPTATEVKEAQKVFKTVTAQHIVEANQAAIAKADKDTFKLTPTGPGQPTKPQTDFLKEEEKNKLATIKEHQAQDLRVSEGTSAAQPLADATKAIGFTTSKGSTYSLKDGVTTRTKAARPEHPGDEGLKPTSHVTVYVDQVAYSKLSEFASRGTGTKAIVEVAPGQFGIKYLDGPSVGKVEKRTVTHVSSDPAVGLQPLELWNDGKDAHFGNAITKISYQNPSASREPFKLTPPPGGARRPPTPKQLDLLNIIAKEPEPEQLAMEMAKSIEHPELSQQFLSMIRKAQDAITFGKTEDVGKALGKIQGALTPKAKPAPGTVTQLSRLTTQEKKALQTFFQKSGGKPMTDMEMLQALTADPSLQPEALIQAIANAKNPTWRDAGQYLVINSMLGPASDFVNFFATVSMLPVHLVARTVAARVGQAAKVLGGRAGVIVGEDEASLHGLYASFWDSVKLAGRVVKTNIPEIGPAAIRETQLGQNPLSSQAVFGYSPTARKLAGITTATDAASSSMLSRAGVVSRAIDTIGVVTGLPGRLMLTGDQFIQNMAMNGEQHALVYRKATEQAVREGLSEAEFSQAYGPLWRSVTKNLPSEIREKGEQFSLDVSLNQNLGPIGQTILNTRETIDQYTGILGTIALPFFKTLVNSSKQTWEFSPLAPTSQALGLVAKQFRNDMFGSDPAKRDLAIGKWAVGTIMMSSMVAAAVNGRLRGRGPDNKELQQQSRDAHGLTDSVVLNADDGTSVQINRFGIVANLAGMAADASEVWLQADDMTKGEIAQLLTTAYVGNLSFDFLQNSSGVIHAIANGVKTEQDLDLLARSLSSVVPLAATIRSAEKLAATDETPLLMKDARDSLDKIRARFPGYDTLAKRFGLEPVPVLRNQFGYAVRQPSSAYGTEWFNAMHVSHPSQTEGIREISEIQMALGMAIQQPPRSIGQRNLPLTNQEYDHYQQLAGEQWELRAKAILPTLRGDDLPDERKRLLISTQLREARSVAAKQLFGEEPGLVDAVSQQKRTLNTTLRTPRNYKRPLSDVP